jgi:hypothetical protein
LCCVVLCCVVLYGDPLTQATQAAIATWKVRGSGSNTDSDDGDQSTRNAC